MGHDTHHPIRKRLAQALTATIECLSRDVARLPSPAPDAGEDERRLREWVLRHHARYGLDPIWILTGVGQPSSTLRQTDDRLTPVFAMSAIDPHTGSWRPYVVERIALGPELIDQDQFVLRMDDRSMEPRIRQGAYLIVDPHQKTLPEKSPSPEPAGLQGRIFAVEVPGEGLVARITQVETPAHRVLLSSLCDNGQVRILPRTMAQKLVKGRVIRIAQSL